VQGLGGAPGFPEHGLNLGAGLVDHVLGLVLRLGDQVRTVSLRLVKCRVRFGVGLGGHLVGHVLGASDRAGLKIVIDLPQLWWPISDRILVITDPTDRRGPGEECPVPPGVARSC
jgi:hypothetical protein